MSRNEQVLRAQVKMELKDKRRCAYQPYECSHLNVEGSKYCLKHILQDKNAAFRQCNFFYQSSGKRCHRAAAKKEKKEHGYCSEHSIKAALQVNKKQSANRPPVTAESLLSNLTLYLKQQKKSSSHENAEDQGTIVEPPDPTAFDVTTIFNDRCKEVLDMCSDSESDVEAATNAGVWHDAQADSSDNESIDSEQEDPLKHANVYTSEEITFKARDQLIKLHSHYVEQFDHLHNQMREIKRNYIYNLKREKETCCNIYSQIREHPKEQRLYKKLKRFGNYNKSSGEDAINTRRLHDLRKRMRGVKSYFSRCLFTEDGVKCCQKPIYLAKHCRKHITEDANQALYVACGKVNFDVKCNLALEGLFEDSACKIHKVFPMIRSYSQARTSLGNKLIEKDSESDPDDTLDLPPHFAMPTSDSIKTETMDYSLSSLTKMETLPSLLFEDSAESLSSTLQYSTSEFTETFAEHNSSDLQESNNTANSNVIDDIGLAESEAKIVEETKTSDDIFQFKIQNFNDEPELEQKQEEEETVTNKETQIAENKQEELKISEETLTNSETTESVSEIAENILEAAEIETTNIDVSREDSSNHVGFMEEENKSDEKMEVDG
ncbi:unnamed protein product [Ceutorhynchus assimilis]|uniref:KAT8 regulatory NSL complex subunit 2 n=1 Tax=Ceutorhynchus assimilis TaxID=467358 RepID=A0A9N9QK50_9CUCU|nr:unnamed protein product [Ceutorhynchus assimilis]